MNNLKKAENPESQNSCLCATTLTSSASFVNFEISFSSLANAAISLTAVKLSSMTPLSFLETSTLAKVLLFTATANSIRKIKTIGKKAKQIAAKSAPLTNAITTPEMKAEKEKMMFENFSPMESCMTKKLSAICVGSYSTLTFSK